MAGNTAFAFNHHAALGQEKVGWTRSCGIFHAIFNIHGMHQCTDVGAHFFLWLVLAPGMHDSPSNSRLFIRAHGISPVLLWSPP